MEKLLDINQDGYSIRCKIYYAKEFRQIEEVVIATYGFGGSKENKGIAKMAERFLGKRKNGAVLVFDWPCMGADARKKLLLSECLTYLTLVIQYAKETLHATKLYNYSTSFGAFMTLKYIGEVEQPWDRIVLRSAAICLDRTMNQSISPEDHEKLKKGKEVLAGHERQLKIDQAFLDDLAKTDLMHQDFMGIADQCLLIHGTKDAMIPLEEIQEFSENNVIDLVIVEQADHGFMDPSKMDFAIAKTIEFLIEE
ncbi:MAG: hypothetical protein K6C69_03745 [Lachnospiraceae bacterium]|nr:hypothetical protein [Lachnospiraceae bacterium]